MSDSLHFYKGFHAAIQQKEPHKATLVNAITDMLAIDKDAVYRRLRGEVNFSFAEMSIIARNMGISLDVIAGIENMQSKPAKMNFSRQVNPSDVDYEMFEGHVHLLRSIKHQLSTKLIESGTIFPHYLYNDFEHLTRFYMFMWNRFTSSEIALPYHEVLIPERLKTIQSETCVYARHIKSTQYVWDHAIFQRLVTDVKYFARIGLIKDEDVNRIKNDLKDFLDYIENMTFKGQQIDTGNEVSIYIFDTNCDANYSCLKSNYIEMTLFRTFILNAIVSMDNKVYEETCNWIRSLQRMSTLISVSGEKTRAAFFNTQRKIINAL